MISHKNKFIFVHINKTGGTSIRSILNQFVENKRGDHQFLNKKMDFIRPAYAKKPGQRVLKESLFENCIYPTEEYFKFAFVRNPYDRLTSAFFHRKTLYPERKTWEKNSFKDWVLNKNNYCFMDGLVKHNQLHWIADEEKNVLVDFIGRFENIQEDFSLVCNKIGIPPIMLPHLNKTKHNHYKEYYDDETREFVEEYYKDDIKYFGYKF